MQQTNPVFVKIEKYNELMQLISVLEKKMQVAKQTLNDLEDLKAKEDEELGLWQKHIEEINHKLALMKDEMTK